MPTEFAVEISLLDKGQGWDILKELSEESKDLLGRYCVNVIQDYIDAQNFPLDKPETVARKVAQGLSPETLIATGEMYRAVDFKVDSNGDLLVGFPAGVCSPEIIQRAIYMEYGTVFIAAKHFISGAIDVGADKIFNYLFQLWSSEQ